MDAWIERVGRAGAWLFALAVCITVYEVLARYVFTAPTSWANALTTTLCATAFALGGAYCMVRGEHIRITTLLERLSVGQRHGAELLACICGVIFLAGLSYGAIFEAVDSVWRFENDRWAPEPTPGPPNWPLPAITRVMLAVGATLFLIVVIRALVRRVRSPRAPTD